MQKTLVIVESPAKAKTIGKYLGKEYDVIASVGHIRDLPKSNKTAVDIEDDFKPSYVVSPGKEKVVADIKKRAKTAGKIILATDPDREGEAIAWHIKELLPKESQKNTERVVYHEITKDAVQEAFAHPRKIDEHLREAQEARRVLDRLVGYELSGLIWKKVRYGLSAGRVQSPALRIIMEREREIRAFIPEDFWVITADVENAEKTPFILACTEEPRDKELVDKIVETGKKEKWVVKDIKETKVAKRPRAPFITSTLQQAASSRLGFSPARTMGIAQKLYEKGHITYMRTDSTLLSKQAIAQIASVVEEKYGDGLFKIQYYGKKSKNAQEAHEAIRPTNISKESAGMNPEQKELYELIWARTVSSQMIESSACRTKIIVQIGDGSVPDFAINGSRVLSPGWMLADPRARREDVELPKVQKDEELKMTEMHVEDKQTQPPNRYSEAGLVKELEKRGIGRPSTYASTIKTLQDRGYVLKEGRALLPTDTGDVVSSFLEEHFLEYINDDFTAEMEDKLDEVAAGEREYAETVASVYHPLHKDIDAKEDIEKLTTLGKADKKIKCPKCKKDMDIKLGRGGKFLSCSTFPDCDGALTIDGIEIKPDEPIGKDPETDMNVYLKDGRFGPYVQVGEDKDEKGKKRKPRRASVPKEKNIEDVTIEDALKYLSLPRTLGTHPETEKEVLANIGRFGPYIGHMIDPKPDYRSLKGDDDPYNITFERALEILKEPKKRRGARKTKKK